MGKHVISISSEASTWRKSSSLTLLVHESVKMYQIFPELWYLLTLLLLAFSLKVYLRAENPPKMAPDAIPTQKPIMNPILILSKQLGPWPMLYPLGGGAGMIYTSTSCCCSKTHITVIYNMVFEKNYSTVFKSTLIITLTWELLDINTIALQDYFFSFGNIC